VLERKAAGLLAWLVLQGPATRQRVTALLWPDASIEAGRNSLRQLLFKLRKSAGQDLFEGAETLGLTQSVHVDEDRGRCLLEGHEFRDCPEFADWLEGQRERWAAEGLARSLSACDAAEAGGDLHRATELARALVERDPLGEPGQQRWLRALYLRGDRAAALTAAQAFEQRLADELGVQPSPAMQDLIAMLKAEPASRPSALEPPVPLTVLRPPRLVGRSAAASAVRRAQGEAAVPMLIGEPGQGKSRLISELLRAGELSVAARPSDVSVPYASLARLLRVVASAWPEALLHVEAHALHALLPDLVAVPQAENRGSTVRASPLKAAELTVSLAHQHGLCGLWLDDLQFFDTASLEALEMLLDAPQLNRLAFGLARRPAEGGAVLTRLIDQLIDGGRLAQVALLPLAEAEVAELVNSLGLPGVDGGALAPTLRRSTGGNPLFVLETLKAALLEGRVGGLDTARLPRPESVMTLIQRRLTRLSTPALNLARVAALAGTDFDIGLAAAVLERTPLELADAWGELEAAQILRDHAFAHDLIFEGTLASVPLAICRVTRGTIAAVLEDRGGEPGHIAAHWLAAGEPGRAAPQFQATAARAESSLRYAEARAAMEQAAACFDTAGMTEAALQARVALANLWLESGEAAHGLAVLKTLAHAEAAPDALLNVACETLRCLAWMGRPDEGAQWGLQRLQDPDLVDNATPRAVARLRSAVADTFNAAGRGAQALAQLQLAAPYYAGSGDAQECGWYHSDMASALRKLGHYAAARGHLEQALALARSTGRLRMVAGVLQVLSCLEHESGHLLPALERVEEAQRLMTAADLDSPFAVVLEILALREQVQLGRLAAACEQLDALRLRAADAPGKWPCVFQAWRVRAWAWAGQPGRAQDSAAALAAAPAGPVVDALRASLALDLAALQAKGAPPVPRWCATFDGQPLLEAETKRLDAAWACLGAAEALDVAAWREFAQRSGDAGLALLAEVADCRRAARAGDAAAVLRSGEVAFDALRRVTVPGLYRPTLWLSLADTLHEAAPALARRVLRDGADWVHAISRLQLPPALRQSFLQNNPVNRRLLAAHEAASAA
jgi:DNA-binding SARP family transcriptional activator/tetratricopeptide (TPR) repeat protein